MEHEKPAEWTHPGELVPWPDNPRRNDHTVDEVARSIERYGFGAPVVARREDRMIIAGHTRVKAALQLGLAEVPVRFMDISEGDARELALVDNKTSELSEWSATGLADLSADMDLGDLGWSDGEIAALTVSPGLDSISRGMGNGSQGGNVEIVVAMDSCEVLEAAMRATGVPDRGAALLEICESYLATKG